MSASKDLKRKMPWDERIQIINEQFPSTVHLDWCRAFEDVELFGRILRDILKVDQTPPGRSGPRPVLDRDAATRRLRQFMRSDYSSLSFQETFQLLAGDRSHRALAAKIGIDRNMVQKLLAGSREPDIPLMEMIARAFKKDPSYFVEYRTAYVLGALGDKMQSAPETTIDLYKKLKPRS